MNKVSISEKIPEDFRRRLVDCINIALQEDLPRYLADYHPETTNGIPHQIGDWINTNIKKFLTSGKVDVMKFARYSWKGTIIIDSENKVTYSIMRAKRVRQLRLESREKPHYLQTIVSVLNEGFEADEKQMTMTDMEFIDFDEETLSKDYETIFNGRIDKTEGYLHCVAAYETEHNEITDIRICFLDKDLDVIDEVSLNEYIKPDFAKLTSVKLTEPTIEEEEQPSSAGLLSLRISEDSSENSSPVAIKEVRNQA